MWIVKLALRRPYTFVIMALLIMILGIHRLMSEGLTPTNLIGNAVATIVVAKWEGALDETRMHKVLNS